MRCLLRAPREPEITMAAAAAFTVAVVAVASLLTLLLLLLLLLRGAVGNKSSCWFFRSPARTAHSLTLSLSLALTYPSLCLTGNPPCCAPSPRTTMGCVTLLLPWFSIITVVMFALHLRARQATSDGHKGLNSRRQLRKNALIKVFNLFLITICTHFSA